MCHDDLPRHPALLTPQEHEGLTRRGALRRLGGAGLGLAGLGAALGGGLALTARPEPAYAASCVLTPELTEGPYYLDLRKLRRTITEGRPGLRLDLRLRVVDASSCRPLSGVAVDLWHADAAGKYSGIASEGTSGKTYLRGIQLTDAQGLARLTTIYPGWYEGRATHIHVRCHVGGRTSGTTYEGGTDAHTGQLFFRDATTDRLARIAPYASRTITRVRNTQDGIYRQGGAGQVLRLTRRGSALRSGFTGTVTMGIDA